MSISVRIIGQGKKTIVQPVELSATTIFIIDQATFLKALFAADVGAASLQQQPGYRALKVLIEAFLVHASERSRRRRIRNTCG